MIKNFFLIGGLVLGLYGSSFGTEKPHQELTVSLSPSSPSVKPPEKASSSKRGVEIELYNNHPTVSYTLNLQEQMESWQGTCCNATVCHSKVKVMIFCDNVRTKKSFFFPIQGKVQKICLVPGESILLNIDFLTQPQHPFQENFQQFIRIRTDPASYITVLNRYSLDGMAFYSKITPIYFSDKTKFMMPILKPKNDLK